MELVINPAIPYPIGPFRTVEDDWDLLPKYETTWTYPVANLSPIGLEDLRPGTYPLLYI
jgi:hypothetical protein